MSCGNRWGLPSRRFRFNRRLKPRVFSSSSAILREEVKYVHTDTDLMITERAARGKKDIVLGYVLSLGTRGAEQNEGVTVASRVK